MLLKRVAAGVEDAEDVIDMTPSLDLARDPDAEVAEAFLISFSETAPGLCPVFEVPQLDLQDRPWMPSIR